MIFSIQTAHILALLTAFGFASSTAAVRYGMRTSSPLTAILTLALVTLALFGPAAVMAVRSQTLDPWGVLTLILAGIAAPGLAGTCHYMGVRRIGLSRSTSIVGSSPLVAVVLAVPALGERPSALIFLGTFLIVLGIVFLSHGRESVTPEGENRTFWQGAAFAGMASLMFGIAGILRKAGITLVPAISVALCASSIGSLITIAVWQVFAPKVDRIQYGRKNIGFFLLSSTLNCMAHVAYYSALQRAPISSVAPIAYTTPLWALILSWLLFRDVECLSGRLVLGAVLVVLGATFVTLSRPG